MNIATLKKLGLKDKEIRIYLVLLEQGSVSIRSLSEIVGFNRGTAYDGLKKLCDLGLVVSYGTKERQKYTAEKPEKLLDLASRKEKEVQQFKLEAQELVESLKAIEKKDPSQPAVKYFEGDLGIRKILDDLLQTLEKEKEKTYYAYSAKNASEDLGRAYPDFTKKRIKKGIKVKVISLAKGGKTHGLDQRRWLQTDDRSASFILIFGSKCAFISRDGAGFPVGVIVENKMIAKTQKLIFEKFWDRLGTEIEK
jgi:HTH-type transcriptional regulator, sugar sensing transcriptional regulator